MVLENPSGGNVRLPGSKAVLHRQRLEFRQDVTRIIGKEIFGLLQAGEREEAVFLLDARRRHQAGMSADGVVHFIFAEIGNLPFDSQLLPLQLVADGQLELIRINGQGFFGCSQTVGNGRCSFSHAGKHLVPGKAMLGFHVVFLVTNAVLAAKHLAHKGEENGRMPVPEDRIRRPDTLLVQRLVPYADQLSAFVRNCDPQIFVFHHMIRHCIFLLDQSVIFDDSFASIIVQDAAGIKANPLIEIHFHVMVDTSGRISL